MEAKTQGVVLVLAAVALILVVVLLAWVNYVPAGSGECPCLGDFLSLGPALSGHGEAQSTWFENLSVLSASTSLTLTNVAFSVQTSEGQAVSPPSDSEVQLLINDTGQLVATFSFATDSWAGAPDTTHVTSQDLVSLVWASPSATSPLRGDRFVVTGQNGFAGTLSVPLS